MIYNNKQISSTKEQLLKIIGSLAVATIFILIIIILPERKEAQLSFTLKLKGNVLFIDYINPLKSRKSMLTIDQVLTTEPQSLNELILAQQSIIDKCKILRINDGDYLVDFTLGKYTLNYNLIVDNNVDVKYCISKINDEMNLRAEEWIKRMIAILDFSRKKAEMEVNLENIYNYEANITSKELYYLIREIPKLRNLKSIEADIKYLEDLVEIKDYIYIINPSLSIQKKPNLLNYFIITFLTIFLVLNIRIIIETLKKY